MLDFNEIYNEEETIKKIKSLFMEKYEIETSLAWAMACEFVEMIHFGHGDIQTLNKYYLQ